MYSCFAFLLKYTDRTCRCFYERLPSFVQV